MLGRLEMAFDLMSRSGRCTAQPSATSLCKATPVPDDSQGWTFVSSFAVTVLSGTGNQALLGPIGRADTITSGSVEYIRSPFAPIILPPWLTCDWLVAAVEAACSITFLRKVFPRGVSEYAGLGSVHLVQLSNSGNEGCILLHLKLLSHWLGQSMTQWWK